MEFYSIFFIKQYFTVNFGRAFSSIKECYIHIYVIIQQKGLHSSKTWDKYWLSFCSVRTYFAQALSKIAFVDLYFILIGSKWAASGDILIAFEICWEGNISYWIVAWFTFKWTCVLDKALRYIDYILNIY